LNEKEAAVVAASNLVVLFTFFSYHGCDIHKFWILCDALRVNQDNHQQLRAVDLC